jgi:integrase/recombinase XerD
VTQLRKAMLEELQRRNLSAITTRIYLRSIEEFARYYQKSPDQLGPEHIRQYQAHLFTERKLGAIAVAQQLSALRFFFLHTLKRPWMLEGIVMPKHPFRLPEVLSREEVERLIQGARSPLHRVWLLILYATGMRREELVRLKVSDIDSGRMLIHIRQGKGRKDRDVMLSPRLLEELRDYWRRVQPKPKTYLFPSKDPHQKRDVPMQAKSVFDAVQQAARRARPQKTRPPAHPATLLRYSSARVRRRPTHHSTAAGPCRSEDHQPLSSSVGAPSQSCSQPAGFAQPPCISEADKQRVNESAAPGAGRHRNHRSPPFHRPSSRVVHLDAPEGAQRYPAMPHRCHGRSSGSVLRLRPSRHLL